MSFGEGRLWDEGESRLPARCGKAREFTHAPMACIASLRSGRWSTKSASARAHLVLLITGVELLFANLESWVSRKRKLFVELKRVSFSLSIMFWQIDRIPSKLDFVFIKSILPWLAKWPFHAKIYHFRRCKCRFNCFFFSSWSTVCFKQTFLYAMKCLCYPADFSLIGAFLFQVERKRHIGNDIVNIIFLNGSYEDHCNFKPSMIKSQFTRIQDSVTFLVLSVTRVRKQ